MLMKEKYWTKDLEKKCKESCRRFVVGDNKCYFEGGSKNGLFTINDILFQVCWNEQISNLDFSNLQEENEDLYDDVIEMFCERIRDCIDDYLTHLKNLT